MQLVNEGYSINHKTVQKLMTQMHLKSKVRIARYKSYKGEVGRAAPNIINQDFKSLQPNKKWATDVTEFKINDKKTYLSPIIDMFNGEIISYIISDRPDLQMVIDMINRALSKTNIGSGLILHSDQGWQYQHKQYQKCLQLRELYKVCLEKVIAVIGNLESPNFRN